MAVEGHHFSQHFFSNVCQAVERDPKILSPDEHTVDGRNPALPGTTWDGRKAINNGINNLLSGAGFLPSTVFPIDTCETL